MNITTIWVHLHWHCIPEYQSKLVKHFWACHIFLFPGLIINDWGVYHQKEPRAVSSPNARNKIPSSASSISCSLSLLTLELLITMPGQPTSLHYYLCPLPLWLWHHTGGHAIMMSATNEEKEENEDDKRFTRHMRLMCCRSVTWCLNPHVPESAANAGILHPRPRNLPVMMAPLRREYYYPGHTGPCHWPSSSQWLKYDPSKHHLNVQETLEKIYNVHGQLCLHALVTKIFKILYSLVFTFITPSDLIPVLIAARVSGSPWPSHNNLRVIIRPAHLDLH